MILIFQISTQNDITNTTNKMIKSAKRLQILPYSYFLYVKLILPDCIRVKRFGIIRLKTDYILKIPARKTHERQ